MAPLELESSQNRDLTTTSASATVAPAMSDTENESSLTRAASTNWEGAKSKVRAAALVQLPRHELAPNSTVRMPRRWFNPQLAVLLCFTPAFATPGANSVRGGTIRDDQPDQSYLDLGASPQYGSVGTFSSGL